MTCIMAVVSKIEVFYLDKLCQSYKVDLHTFIIFNANIFSDVGL